MLATAMKLIFAFLLPIVAALKFDIQANPGHESASKERCIRNFVAEGQLVVVTATVSGNRGDGQVLNMHVSLRSRSIMVIQAQECLDFKGKLLIDYRSRMP